MIIKRSRTLTFQPRQYESIVVSAAIEFDSSIEPKKTGKTPEKFADDVLTLLLEDEINAAAAVTDNPKSFITTYRYSGE
jgi:hypothetical protein